MELVIQQVHMHPDVILVSFGIVTEVPTTLALDVACQRLESDTSLPNLTIAFVFMPGFYSWVVFHF